MFSIKLTHIRLIAAISLIATLLVACGGTPKEVDHDGLRQRADEETSQVR